MNNERPRVTLNLPVDFNINYNEDGTIYIDIDTKVLESRLAQSVINSLEAYINKPKELEIEEPKLTTGTILELKPEDTWFRNTKVVVSDDGLLKVINFPNDLSINFVYDENGNIVRVVNQGQICDIETIGSYILRYDVR